MSVYIYTRIHIHVLVGVGRTGIFINRVNILLEIYNSLYPLWLIFQTGFVIGIQRSVM